MRSVVISLGVGRLPLVCASLACLLLAAPLAEAQNESHWGATVSFAPTATARDGLFKDMLINFEGEGQVRSSEFTVGLVRGSVRGGDWGVSLVKKSFEDGSRSVVTESSCFVNNCSTFTETRVMRDVLFTGVEFHWAPTFVTIKDRVQVGVNIGGGIAEVSGIVHETQVDEGTGRPPFVYEDDRPAKDVLFALQPLLKIEAQGSVIVAPGLKVRVAGGFNAPGMGVRVAAVYLFGAH